MLLYIDDDSVDGVLIRRLTDNGYDIVTPSIAGTAGQADPVHLMCAIRYVEAVRRSRGEAIDCHRARASERAAFLPRAGRPPAPITAISTS